MKETIIYVGGFRLPDGNAAAQRVISNGKLLCELGYDVVFIGTADDREKNVMNTKTTVCGFDCYSVRYPKNGAEWLRYITDTSSIYSVMNRYGGIRAVIAYNYPAAALFKLKKYCKKHGCKIIADCTEWYPRSKNIIKNIDSDIRMKVLQPRLDGVICISRFLESYYSKHTKTVYLPPLTDINDSKWNVRTSGSNVLTLTYAGSPGKHKDKLNLIIEALNETAYDKDYIFNIVGITEEQYLGYYPSHRGMLESSKGKIFFRGRVSHEDAIRYVKSADYSIFFRPDTLVSKAGFPTKFVEAVTCGTPVITNATSDLSEYIKDGENAILIGGYAKKDIGDAINRVFTMPDSDRQRIKENCFAKRDTFDYRRYRDKFEKFMRAV